MSELKWDPMGHPGDASVQPVGPDNNETPGQRRSISVVVNSSSGASGLKDRPEDDAVTVPRKPVDLASWNEKPLDDEPTAPSSGVGFDPDLISDASLFDNVARVVGNDPARMITNVSKAAEEAGENGLDRNSVVGWLVCIQGPAKGLSFRLHEGRNFIGRSQAMDVYLSGDQEVSRDVHAVIVYEPKKGLFFAQKGMGHSLFYLNDKVVLDNVVLKDRDMLEIGRTQLMFVPFCDERFRW